MKYLLPFLLLTACAPEPKMVKWNTLAYHEIKKPAAYCTTGLNLGGNPFTDCQ